MNHAFVTRLLPLLSIVLAGTLPTARAENPLLFVSTFKPAREGAIHTFRLDVKSGKLTSLERNGDVENPFFLALAPDGEHLYSIHAAGGFGGEENEEVAAFKILDDSGRLQLLNRRSARGTAACYLDVDSSGKTLVVANYSSGSVAALPIRGDGSLGEATSFHPHRGSGVNPRRQEGPHAHCIVVSPDNRFALAADLGLDKIISYALQPETSRLTAARQPFVRTIPGAGPRHLTFHPNGRQMYVINELANSITRFEYQADSGFLIERETLSTLPEDFDGTSYCADLKITPDGRFLYGTNRGHDSIAAYRIGEDGRLTLLGIHSSNGKGPQNLAITAGGDWLLCANMPGNNLAVFRIDPESGDLAPVGEPLSIPGPSCIMLHQ
jgi:6-phosphogluconolactonase